jgi:ACS family hexuronate transporter-like MFS transporter
LFGVLLVIGFGSLGLFPNYYAFTQELTMRRQGVVAGSLGAITWVVTSRMQHYVGRNIDETQSYATGIFAVGLAPLVAWLALVILWGSSETEEKA